MLRKIIRHLKRISGIERPPQAAAPHAGHTAAHGSHAKPPPARAGRPHPPARGPAVPGAHPPPHAHPATPTAGAGAEGSVPPAKRRRRRRGGRGRRRGPETGAPPPRGPREPLPTPSGGAAPDRRQERAPAREPQPAHTAVPAPPPPDFADRAAAHAAWDPAGHVVPPEEGKTRFHDLPLRGELLHAVADLGFRYCTPIQALALPAALEGRDVTGRAQTGTGKTAAFLLSILQRFMEKPPGDRKPGTPRALILAPTRELVMQIERDAHDLAKYAPCRVAAIFGGADFDRQRRTLAHENPEIIAATPGRLLDFRARCDLHLGRVEVLVIDEADRMLDMGFIPDVRRIVYSTPPKERRQTMFFSATLTEDVLRLARSWTRDPVHVNVEPEQVTVDTIDQRLYVVTAAEKFAVLYNLLQREQLDRVLLFVNRRDTAEWLASELNRHRLVCEVISGALPQNRRTRTLEAFRDGQLRILVATDVAARGLHIEGISHVVNYNVPVDAEDYVHRIGRTGRAGASGTSITFACEEEAFYLPAIEKYLGRELKGTHPPDDWLAIPAEVVPTGPPTPLPRFRRAGGGGRFGPRRGGPRRGGRR